MDDTPCCPGRPPSCAPFGRRAKRRARLAAVSLSGLTGLLAPFLPVFLWLKPKRGAGSRDRLSNRGEVFMAFLAMVLQRGASTRFALALLQANRVAAGKPMGSNNTSGFCQARAALPVSWLKSIFMAIGAWFERGEHAASRWRGRRVRLLDGSGFSMPDSDKNRAVYPLASGQKRGIGFPAGKLAGLFCLHTGRILGFKFGTWKQHDLSLAGGLLGLLKVQDILVADRAYGSWLFLVLLQAKGVDFAIRLHQARAVNRKRKSSWVENWPKPLKHKKQKRAEGHDLPEILSVRIVAVRVQRRGFRSHLVFIVTSLLDKTEFPDAALGELYGLRWQVELHLRQIKVSLGLDVLRCVSPAMIERELWMHVIAYNLIRALMTEAASIHRVEIEQLSFKGTLTALQQWERIAFGRTKRMRHFRSELLSRIATDLVPHRPGRSEPRAKKRRPKNYPLLTKPRKIYRVSPSRSQR
jgi:hypothetical protein